MSDKFGLGQKIKKFRIRSGFSQLQLEMAIDSAFGAISRMESGKTNPTKETLLRIIEVLNLNTIDAASLFNLDLKEIIKSNSQNDDLRTQLSTLNKLLGIELLDNSKSDTNSEYRFTGDAEKVLRQLSKVAAQLSLAFISVRKSKDQLSGKELKDYENMKLLIYSVGNLQDKLNNIIKTSKKIAELNEQLKQQTINLSTDILEAKDKFQNAQSNINVYTLLAKNPELAYLFNKENANNN